MIPSFEYFDDILNSVSTNGADLVSRFFSKSITTSSTNALMATGIENCIFWLDHADDAQVRFTLFFVDLKYLDGQVTLDEIFFNVNSIIDWVTDDRW